MQTNMLIKNENTVIKVYASERGYIYYLYGNDVYYHAKDNPGYTLPEGLPSTARYLCPKAMFEEYRQKGLFG